MGDGYESPQAVTDAGGNVIATFVYAGEHAIAKITPSGVEYFLGDAMGSVIGKASSAGASTASIRYDAFGNVTSAVGASAGIDAGIGAEPRFHGMTLDAGTGLYFVRARTYDSRTGRFVSRDRVAGVTTRPETMNPYVMDHGNPHVWRDPSGRFSLGESMAVSAIIGIAGSLGLPSLNNYLNSVRAYKNGSDARVAAIITNYGTGFSDTISFGMGKALRDLGGIGGVDTNSSEYFAGMATGLAAQYWAGFFTAGAAGTGMAIYSDEIAPQAVDHVVLGLRPGLQQAAEQVGGRTLLKSTTWEMDVLEAVANPSVRISVSLRGLNGATTYEKIMNAASRGAAGVKFGGATNWEISQLVQAGRLRTVQFLDDAGRVVENPFL
jgi:RHS repeat-associated protein